MDFKLPSSDFLAIINNPDFKQVFITFKSSSSNRCVHFHLSYLRAISSFFADMAKTIENNFEIVINEQIFDHFTAMLKNELKDSQFNNCDVLYLLYCQLDKYDIKILLESVENLVFKRPLKIVKDEDICKYHYGDVSYEFNDKYIVAFNLNRLQDILNNYCTYHHLMSNSIKSKFNDNLESNFTGNLKLLISDTSEKSPHTQVSSRGYQFHDSSCSMCSSIKSIKLIVKSHYQLFSSIVFKNIDTNQLFDQFCKSL